MSETQTVMCINAGSSSLKFHLYEMGESTDLLARGAVEGIGQGDGRLWFVDWEGTPITDQILPEIRLEQAIDQMIAMFSAKNIPSIEAIGHRMVHGGPNHFEPELVTDKLLDDLRAHVAWAPLHLPASLRAIEAFAERRRRMPQVVCFDTAFHARIPEIARRLPLPRRFYGLGVHKYGFHGLSYEYVLGVLGERAKGRVIMAHLGNGASMSACSGGRPVETTMGMTPLGGFMMGTRTGDLDPGVLLYLTRECGYDDKSLEQLLDGESGLKGVSGETADMEALLQLRAASDAAAGQAVEMFCYQARKTVGALAASMGGLDLLVFTGGIGENAPLVRALICEHLEFLGIRLDPARNAAGLESVSPDDAPCQVLVVPTNEELMIARHTYAAVWPEGGAR
jgi:acetate kinase